MTTISVRISQPTVLTHSSTVGLGIRSFFARIGRLMQSGWCVVNGGHYKVLHTEPDRLALRCVACGDTSPGWAVGSSRLARPAA